MEKLAKAFLSADIPLYELNNKHITNLFHHIDHSLLSETTCWKTLLQLAVDELQWIGNAVHQKQIFLIVDKSTLFGIQYFSWKY